MDAIPRYLSPVSIIPGGCPQFLDFSLSEEAIRRLRRYFREEKKQEGEAQGRYTHYLRCLVETENGFVDQLTGQPCSGCLGRALAARPLFAHSGQPVARWRQTF